jgi:hypothetical protein
MNARRQVKEILVSKKMRKWCLIGQHPNVYPDCPAWKARKNYQRLFYRYRELAEKIGLHECSAYE